MVVAEFNETESRPERMRVIFLKSCSEYLVQSFSRAAKTWITMAEWKNETDALVDCATWYKS